MELCEARGLRREWEHFRVDAQAEEWSFFLRRPREPGAVARLLKFIQFFLSRVKLTRESGENSCACGQTWYRNGTELVPTGRKLDVTCTKPVLVGMEAGKLARLRTKKRAGHAVPVRLLNTLNIVASWGAALRTGPARRDQFEG